MKCNQYCSTWESVLTCDLWVTIQPTHSKLHRTNKLQHIANRKLLLSIWENFLAVFSQLLIWVYDFLSLSQIQLAFTASNWKNCTCICCSSRTHMDCIEHWWEFNLWAAKWYFNIGNQHNFSFALAYGRFECDWWALLASFSLFSFSLSFCCWLRESSKSPKDAFLLIKTQIFYKSA